MFKLNKTELIFNVNTYIFISLIEFFFLDEYFLYPEIYTLIWFIFCDFLTKFSVFNFLCIIIIFFKILSFNKSKILSIKRLSIFFCVNIMKIFLLHLFKFPLLYSYFYLLYSFNWFGLVFNIKYSIGLDNLGFIFVFLTVFLIPISLLISWKSIYYNTKYFFILFLILEILLINVFCAVDLMLFYISFESILIPMYFLIGYWGSRDRKFHAAYQFFLFTLGGSLFMLIILIFCQLNFGSTNYNFLLNVSFSPYRELFMWGGFFIAFAVKIPMMPVHIWLPEAHVESATGGSVALAGILLKLGTYGIIRFLIPLFKFSSFFFTPFIFLISFFGVFYASLTTLRQIDLKKIIAYSSVIHMNYLMFGLFAYNIEGYIGSIILMVAHGFVSGGLFVCVGVLYERYHTRLKKPYGGLNNFMPFFSIFFLILTLANISFPGSINFIGEFLVLLSILMKNFFLGFFVIFSMILSTCYSLWLYNKVFSGLVPSLNYSFYQKISFNGLLFKSLFFKRFFLMNYSDLNLREVIIIIYLLVPVIFLGLNPNTFIGLIEFDSLIYLTLLLTV